MHNRRFAAALRRRRRFVYYILLAAAMFVSAVSARAFQAHRDHSRLSFIVSDAKGYYVYLPSAFIDGDLDFSNQMIATWGKELDPDDFDLTRRTATGLVPDKYPIGMALTLLPAFTIAHGFTLAADHISANPAFIADGYSPPYQLLCLALILALACATMMMMDVLIEQHFRLDGRAIALGIIAFWIGSHYAWYSFREPFMVHVVSAFWVTATVFLCVVIRREAIEAATVRPRHVALLGLCFAMACICRPTNIFIAPFLIWTLTSVFRMGLVGKLARAMPLAVLVALVPLVLQLVTWHILYGSWFHYGYEDERFVWAHPALLQTLFSLEKGLFVWTPLLLLAMAGLLWRHNGILDGERRGFIVCGLISATILWYLNSSWWCWGFGWSFGGRAFLELAAIFIVGLALAFHWAIHQPPLARRLVGGLVVVLIVYNYVLMGLYQCGVIDRGGGLTGGWTIEGAPRRELAKLEQKVRALHPVHPPAQQARSDP
ncbi:MAG TPA: hypothetical protein VH518_13575 [Tepidisphaeraceae bacterium]